MGKILEFEKIQIPVSSQEFEDYMLDQYEKLKVGESFVHPHKDVHVLRVPGGWIHTIVTVLQDDSHHVTSVFVNG